VKAALSAMTIKTDRHDARGIAQIARTGWFKAVHDVLSRLLAQLGTEPLGTEVSHLRPNRTTGGKVLQLPW
jgi:hypothetical protein